MIIKKIEINAFGKLEKIRVNLDKGMYVFYGPNESGKSTLMEFIKIMFYTRYSKERFSSKDKELRKKYSPWSGKKISGSLEFFHMGNLYRIQKELGLSSSVHDKISVKNLSTGELINLGKKQEIGEYFFKIDARSFERSSYISNVGRSDFEDSKNNSKDSIADKILSNLSSTGEEDVSEGTALKNIENAMRNLKWLRGNGGKIFDTKLNISEINQKIANLDLIKNSNCEIEKKFLETKKLLDEKKALTSKIEKFQSLKKVHIAIEIKRLLDEKDKILSFSEIVEKDEIIEKFNADREIIKNISLKLEEIRKINDSLENDFADISEEEIIILKNLIKEKNEIEYKKSQLNKILINFKLDSDFDEFENIENKPNFKDMEIVSEWLEKSKELRKKIVEINKDIENKRNCLENTKNNSNNCNVLTNKGFIALIIFINTLAILCCNFLFCKSSCMIGITVLIFLNILIFGVYYIKNRKIVGLEKEKFNLLFSQISELESEKNSTLNKIALTQANLKEIFVNYENMLCLKTKVIDDIIFEKDCNSIEDYFINFEKSKNKINTYNSYKYEIENLKSKESEFIKEISKYDKKVTCIKEAFDFLDNVIILSKKNKLIDEKIKNKSENLELNFLDMKLLKAYIEKLIKYNSQNTILNNMEDVNNLKTRLDYLSALNLEDKCIELQKKIKILPDNKENLQKELIEQKDKLKNMESYLKSLEVAKSTLEETSEEMRKLFNPSMDSRASEIFSYLTGGKYKKLNILKKYDISIEHNMHNYNCENFSSGTIDQAYFSLRVAIAEIISNDNCIPIIIDDSLMRYDKIRLEKILNFLINYKKNSFQSIIFTCHGNVAKLAQEKGAKIIFMKDWCPS